MQDYAKGTIDLSRGALIESGTQIVPSGFSSKRVKGPQIPSDFKGFYMSQRKNKQVTC